MKVIPWEDSLNSTQQSVLIGSLLGDARLECRSKSGSARLRIHHAERQRDLVMWKYQVFQDLAARPPWSTDWLDKRNGKTYRSWFFHTKTTLIFREWHQLFYPSPKKVIPQGLKQMLDPLALATWFMDDGCFQDSCIILNTQSFSVVEQKCLSQIFCEKYGVLPTLQKDRKNYRLYFGKKKKQIIENIIRPHVLESFYKTIPVTTSSKEEIVGT